MSPVMVQKCGTQPLQCVVEVEAVHSRDGCDVLARVPREVEQLGVAGAGAAVRRCGCNRQRDRVVPSPPSSLTTLRALLASSLSLHS